MSEFLLLVALLALGPLLVAEGLLARYELMIYMVGRRKEITLPPAMPYARGADANRPPDAYVVYLDGIGKRRFTDTRDGGQLVQAIIAAGPELRVLGHTQPYSPLAYPLVGRPVWDWLRQHAGITLFLHNVMQTFVAADRRYRPHYNRAVSSQIATQLCMAGYEPDNGVPVVLLCYSGAAQVATGAVEGIYSKLRAPLSVIMLGGFHNGANDLKHARRIYRLTSANDWIEKVGAGLFPQRWPIFRGSAWNRELDAGRVTTYSLDPATHVGPESYISPTAVLPDGRSYLDRTAETIIAIIRRDFDEMVSVVEAKKPRD
jgi:hypothetical protein